jgi:hypothetical protein
MPSAGPISIWKSTLVRITSAIGIGPWPVLPAQCGNGVEMKRKAFLVCAIALAAALFSTAAEADRRVALVIGNSAYRNATQLPNTINDANAVAALFRSVGFEVVNSRADLGVLDFKRVVRDFLNTAENADISVVYYAGHGIEINGTNYLIPVDAKLARDYDMEDEAVALDRINGDRRRRPQPDKSLRSSFHQDVTEHRNQGLRPPPEVHDIFDVKGRTDMRWRWPRLLVRHPLMQDTRLIR